MFLFKHLGLCIVLLFSVTCADVISIRGDLWYPYNGAPTSPKPGYMIELAKIVLEKAGHTIEYQTMDWDAALDAVKQGKFTSIVGASPGDAQGFVFPAEEQGVMVNIFAIKKDASWAFTGIDSLKGIKLGCISGYSYNDDIDAYIQKNSGNPKLIVKESGEQAVTKLLKRLVNGEVDAVIEDRNVLFTSFGMLGYGSQLKMAPYPNPPVQKLFIAFSPKNPKSKQYAELISKGISEMRASGALKDLLTKYGLKDWK